MSVYWCGTLDYGTHSGFQTRGYPTQKEAIDDLEKTAKFYRDNGNNPRNLKVYSVCSNCGNNKRVFVCVCKRRKNRYSPHTKKCHYEPCPDCK